MADICAIPGGTRVEICPKMSWRDYCAVVAMSGSVLVKGIQEPDGGSMLALKHEWDHPREPTAGMVWGTAAHTLTLEPHEFLNRYACWDGPRLGNDYKDFVVDAALSGKEVLTNTQWDTVQEAALRFVHHPRIQPIIASGQPEVGVFATELGIQCRGRIDWIASPGTICCREYPVGLIADLKTTGNVYWRSFSRVFYRLHYDVKLGLYQRWVKAAIGHKLPVVIMALQNKAPYDITVYPIDDAVLDRGVEKAMVVFQDLKEAMATGYWPGADGGEDSALDTPSWEMEEELVEFTE